MNRYVDGTLVNNPISGAAGGDLSGTYPAPTVARIQGRSVANVAPADTDVMTWNQALARWEPAAASGGSGTVTAWDAPVDDGSWRLVGTAVIGGGLITLSAGAGSLDPGRASASRSPIATVPSGLETVVDLSAWDAVIRVASLTGNSETFVGLYARQDGSDELRLWATGVGGVGCGYVGTPWTAFGSVGAGSLPLDGTGWLKLTVRGPVVTCWFGTGTTTEPPAETAWTRLGAYNTATVQSVGFNAFRELGPVVSSYFGGVDVTATFDRLRVRNAGLSTRAW